MKLKTKPQTKEESLSDKIMRTETPDYILKCHVKEAVRKLKKGIHQFNETELGDEGRNEFIDKIFGDKLI